MVTRTGLIPPQQNRYRGNKTSQQNAELNNGRIKKSRKDDWPT
jgi:hypothetical protein